MFAYLIRYSVALVACEPEETILGFVMGYTSGTYGAVYTLDVHPGYRRKSIGSELMMALEKKLAGMGAKAVRLEAALAWIPPMTTGTPRARKFAAIS